MKRPKRNYNRSFLRTAPGAQSDGKTFLIVVEGKETERLYFDGFRQRLELKAADVVVEHAGATDPQNMVTAAIALRNTRAEAAKKSVLLAPYDEVWVVFDREAKHHARGKQLPTAMVKAAAVTSDLPLSGERPYMGGGFQVEGRDRLPLGSDQRQADHHQRPISVSPGKAHSLVGRNALRVSPVRSIKSNVRAMFWSKKRRCPPALFIFGWTTS